MYCPICNNPFSFSTTEEHADLCLDNKNKYFFKRQPESNDEEKSVSIVDKKNRNERAFRPTGACVSYLQAVAKV